MRHTQGPWVVDDDVASQVRQPAYSKRRRIVCPPDATGIADARLVSAAPDMLAFLKELAVGANKAYDWNRIVGLIIKAEGDK